MKWLILAKICFSLAWLVWLVTRPLHWGDEGGLLIERKLSAAGTNAMMKAPGVARP